MATFQDFNLTTPLYNALEELEFTTPTPIQEKAFSIVMSGRDVVGIAQTGTGKTLAYLLPIFRMLKYSRQTHPRIFIIVPTRELVVQIVSEINKFSTYTSLRVAGVYGGTNINTQKQAVAQGTDIVVATPGRLFDLIVSRALSVKSIQKIVIDEVDMMLDLGFRPQLTSIFDILPQHRQNLLFSATMTDEVDAFIQTEFRNPVWVSVASSLIPVQNIKQFHYEVPNYYTKVNLLFHLLADKERFDKVLIFVQSKKVADRLFDTFEFKKPRKACTIHSNKSQNYRLESIEGFRDGSYTYMIATDLAARGLDIDDITQVIQLDVPAFPENYVHRIGRTGRAGNTGEAIAMVTPGDKEAFTAIQEHIQMEIEVLPFPEAVEVSEELAPEERPKNEERYNPLNRNTYEPGPAFHEKKEKNKKVNLGGSYRRKLKVKYKKPKTRGDKNANRKRKK